MGNKPGRRHLAPYSVALVATAVVACGLSPRASIGALPVVRDQAPLPPVTGVDPSAPSAVATPSPPVVGLPLSVPARAFKEPNDYAHRNYCGTGASEVLLSAWLATIPPLEEVAAAAHLDPGRGQTGAHTVRALNGYLDPLVVPRLGHTWYRGEVRLDSLTRLVEILQSDLGSREVISELGHGAPVMVQTMTRTMPGWNGWQATHMITIVAADLRWGDPARDTVTYAETPSPMAAYTGPPWQTTSLAALWVAMEAYLANRASASDPVNVIW
jgi:hypothetical protein